MIHSLRRIFVKRAFRINKRKVPVLPKLEGWTYSLKQPQLRTKMQGQTLTGLIEGGRHIGGKPLSYKLLSRNCDEKPSAQRPQPHATSDLNDYTEPDVMRGLRQGTGLSTQAIIHADVRWLGLVVADADPDSLVVAGVSKLFATSVESFKTIERELVALTSEVHHEDQDKPETDPLGKRTHRALGSSVDAGQGQKIPHSDDPDFEVPPPIERLAAHSHIKTQHEKFEEAHGEHGEENQDPDVD